MPLFRWGWEMWGFEADLSILYFNILILYIVWVCNKAASTQDTHTQTPDTYVIVTWFPDNGVVTVTLWESTTDFGLIYVRKYKLYTYLYIYDDIRNKVNRSRMRHWWNKMHKKYAQDILQ